MRNGERRIPGGRLLGLAALGLLLAALAACGDDGGEAVSTTGVGGDGSVATTEAGEEGGGESLPLAGSSSCSDPTGDTDQEIEGEGWPDAFDLTGVEVAVEGEELVVTAHFAGDVTQDSRVDLYLGDLTGFAWDGQGITLDWDYQLGAWAAVVQTLPFTEEIVLPVVTARDNLLVGRIPLENLPKLSAPFQWFAFVSLADFCPDGNLQGTASNPVTFPG
jgi:hypothetical protein